MGSSWCVLCGVSHVVEPTQVRAMWGGLGGATYVVHSTAEQAMPCAQKWACPGLEASRAKGATGGRGFVMKARRRGRNIYSLVTKTRLSVARPSGLRTTANNDEGWRLLTKSTTNDDTDDERQTANDADDGNNNNNNNNNKRRRTFRATIEAQGGVIRHCISIAPLGRPAERAAMADQADTQHDTQLQHDPQPRDVAMGGDVDDAESPDRNPDSIEELADPSASSSGADGPASPGAAPGA
eukprot:4241625-Pyramimonas_sp.AAC.1